MRRYYFDLQIFVDGGAGAGAGSAGNGMRSSGAW